MPTKRDDRALISFDGAQTGDTTIRDIAGGDITNSYQIYQIHIRLTPEGEVIDMGALRVFPNKLQHANRLYPASAVKAVTVRVRERWKQILCLPISLLWLVTWFSMGGYQLDPVRSLVLVPLAALYLSGLWCLVVYHYQAALTEYLVVIRMTWLRRIRLYADSYAHAAYIKELLDHKVGMAD